MLIILATYFLFVILFGIFSWMALYHLWQFGSIGDATKKVIFIYIVTAIIIIVVTTILIVIN